MTSDYWRRQTKDQPLYPDLLWSRPENAMHAGKLAVIGGNLHGFAAPAEAYSESLKAGAGSVRVLLPLAVKKLAGGILPELEYGESNPSGSFGQKSFAEWLSLAAWADGVLLAGDLGRNSETAIVLESFLAKHTGQVTLAKDAVDYGLQIGQKLITRPDTCLVLSMAQLQKLCVIGQTKTAVTLSMDLIRLVDVLHDFTSSYPLHIITKYGSQLIVASGGQVSTTNLATDMPIWRVKTAAHTSVWWLQNPSKPFEALTTGLVS